MTPKPSIAVLLGTHHEPDEEEEEDGEDGDVEEHGEHLSEELCEACKAGDAKKVWECFKMLDELAEHARGEEEPEPGEEPGEEEH